MITAKRVTAGSSAARFQIEIEGESYEFTAFGSPTLPEREIEFERVEVVSRPWGNYDIGFKTDSSGGMMIGADRKRPR